jgi:hypothetical protein
MAQEFTSSRGWRPTSSKLGLALTMQDRADLVSFMHALTTRHPVFRYPVLPE